MRNTTGIRMGIGVFFMLILSGCNSSFTANQPTIKHKKTIPIIAAEQKPEQDNLSPEKRIEIENQVYPERYTGANLHVSFDDILNCNNESNRDIKEQCYYNIFSKQLPLCIVPNIKDNTSITIDNIVKNCSLEQRSGFSRGGLGGGPAPVYTTHNKLPIQTLYIGGGKKFNRDYFKDEEFVCKISLGGEYGYDFASRLTNKYYKDNMERYNAMLSGLESNLISHTHGENYDYAAINCGKDIFCKSFNEGIPRSDNKGNYIMNGYISNILGDLYNGYYYYIINGKLYDPGVPYTDSNGITITTPNESRWLLGKINNNSMNVYKMIDIKYTHPYEPKNENDFSEGRYNTYTLKTCTIDL